TNAQVRHQPAANQGADDADGNVTDNAKSAARDNFAGEPASNEPDQQNDEKTLPRNVHCPASSVAWQFSCTRQSPGEPTGSRVLRNAAPRPQGKKGTPADR